MSEARKPLFEPQFNRAIKIRVIDERLSSDAGVLQLRCIKINGDWDPFVGFVHQKLREKTAHDSTLQTLLTWHAAPLPTFGVNS